MEFTAPALNFGKSFLLALAASLPIVSPPASAPHGLRLARRIGVNVTPIRGMAMRVDSACRTSSARRFPSCAWRAG